VVTRGRVIFVLVAVAVFALDRITKTIVAAQVPYGTEVLLVDHLLGITNVHNSGAAFGTAPAFAGVFLLASIAVSIGLAIYVFRTPATDWMYAMLGLVMGGTVGNGYERLFNGTVIDFINFHFWPVFNVADSAVSIGVVLLIAAYAFRRTES
jgi:signal peptidase II